MKDNIVAFLFISVIGFILLAGYTMMEDPAESSLSRAYLEEAPLKTGAKNVVTAIYLDYRLFDTLLEALLLLVSVIGVSQFAGLNAAERNFPNAASDTKAGSHKPSLIMLQSLGSVYWLIAVFGAYVIMTGMDGPGGGFQGGSILAAIVMSVHFVEGRRLIRIPAAEKLEKFMYILVLLAAMVFLVCQHRLDARETRFYLLFMNIVIGIKVFSGLSILYLHFMDTGTDSGIQ